MSRSGRLRGSADGEDPRRPSEGDVVAGAGGVVFNAAGAVLLLRHANGTWVFPKGHIEPGEGALETALREIEEEAGVVARCDDETTTWTTRYRNAQGIERAITWYSMRTDAVEPVFREALFPDGAFLEPAEALERLSFEEDRKLLRHVLADGSSAGGSAS